uniref:Uncharacterized protein n=2 Tax=Guillardia theta TaxID=55529 RepID=A0A7S4NUC8_GUITH|mmetsp:Transcript_3426/g.11838  ORF Transcript_3426/g.11838 Transcript_3426/m.11838 type:complete len:265 (+) Transcript_3426:83-877(+)
MIILVISECLQMVRREGGEKRGGREAGEEEMMVKPRERGRCGESVTMLMGWQYLQTMHRALAAGRQQRLEDIEQARLQRPPRGACETQLSARLDGRSTRKNAATETEDRSKVGYQHHYPQHYPSCYHPSCITDPACSEKPPPLPPSRDFETTTSLDYQWPQVDEHYNQTRGQRRMRTLDNAPTRGRDRTFLLEHQIASPHVCLEEEERGEDLAPLVEQDVPITIYSAKPQLFPMSNPSQVELITCTSSACPSPRPLPIPSFHFP